MFIYHYTRILDVLNEGLSGGDGCCDGRCDDGGDRLKVLPMCLPFLVAGLQRK